MQSKIFSTFLCSAVVASCVFADVAKSSEPNSPLNTGGGGATSAKSLNSGLSSQALGSQALNDELSSPLSNGKALNSTLLAQNSAPNAATRATGAENLAPKATQTPHTELLALNSAAQTPHSTLLAQNGVRNADTIGTAQTPPPPQEPGFFGRILGADEPQNPEFREPRNPNEPRFSQSDNAKVKTYELGAVEITAPREPDSNPTVASVDKQEMERQGSLDAAQALRMVPGVFYVPSNNGISTIYIRGFSEEETGYYFDGIPISDVYEGGQSGTTDLFPFFTFGLNEIQVSKGLHFACF